MHVIMSVIKCTFYLTDVNTDAGLKVATNKSDLSNDIQL